MCWPLQTAAVEELLWGEAAVQPAGMNAAAAGFGGVLLVRVPHPGSRLSGVGLASIQAGPGHPAVSCPTVVHPGSLPRGGLTTRQGSPNKDSATKPRMREI